MKNVPEKIYLTLGEGANEADDFKDLEEVSWCSHKVEDGDIEYVLAGSLPASLEEAAIEYCNEFHRGGDRTYKKCFESFLAGYNHSLTQNTAKDKEKDELLTDAVEFVKSLRGNQITARMAWVTRYNSLTSSNTSTEPQIQAKELK